MLKTVRLLLALVTMVILSVNLAVAEKPVKPNPNSVLNKIVPVDQDFAGMTYSQLAGEWWQWILGQPAEDNPLFDLTGEFAASGQSGKIWFLAGVGGKVGDNWDPVTREITIPPGKAIFFPIINSIYVGNFPTDTPEIGWKFEKAFIGAVDTDSLQCSIDGVPVPKVKNYRADTSGEPGTWGEFIIDMAPGNIFDNTETTDDDIFMIGEFPAAVDGYWFLLQPLSAGSHTIRFAGKVNAGEVDLGEVYGVQPWGEFKLDVTYHIKVGK